MEEAGFARLMDDKLKHYPTKQELKEEIASAVAPLATRQEMKEAIAPLATKQELKEAIAAAIAPLATKEELAAAVAPLATKEELQNAVVHFDARMTEHAADVKHHFNVVAESLRDEIKIVADAVIGVSERLDRNTDEMRRRLDRHDVQLDGLDIRVARLEEHGGLERP